MERIDSDLITIKKNQIKMMRDRGFVLDDEDEKILNYTDAEFIKHMKIKFDMTVDKKNYLFNKLYTKKDDDNNIVKNYVYYIFSKSDKVKTEDIKDLIDFSVKSDTRRFDIISKNTFHSSADGKLKKLTNTNFKLWSYDELIKYIFDSRYVPRYKSLNKKEIDEIFYQDGKVLIDRSQLPKMIIDDPVCKFMDFQIGQILEFVFKDFFGNSLVNEKLKYRQVVGGTISLNAKDS